MTIPESYIKNIKDLHENDKSFILDFIKKNYSSEVFFNQSNMFSH